MNGSMDFSLRRFPALVCFIQVPRVILWFTINIRRLTRLTIGTYLSAELVEFVRSDAALIGLGSPLGDVRDLAVRKAAVSHESSGPYENYHVSLPCIPGQLQRKESLTVTEMLDRDGNHLEVRVHRHRELLSLIIRRGHPHSQTSVRDE
jgi:hypothetical protein